ncbi:MAG: response regulator transcription factor [Betaproteobacteria bacterium]|nr:response regulator transcription factor [Betaproteobacteria bacterium]
MVYVVDDDSGVRQALGWLLRSRQLDSELFASAEEFLLHLESARFPDAEPTVLVLDVRMDGMSGLELFGIVRERGMLDRLPVIFLTGHADVPTAVDSVKNGALDFFEKPFNDNTLVDRIVEGLGHSQRTLSTASQRGDLARRVAELTEREREVMQLIMQGRLNKVIADQLGISMRTVEVHRSRIFAKLKVRSAVEMVNLLNRTQG